MVRAVAAYALAVVARVCGGAGPPRTAFVLVGAAYDVKAPVIARYLSNVVEAYAGAAATSTFALVKALHFNGKPYSAADVAALNGTLARTLRPAALLVTAEDPTVARFESSAVDAVDCLWPRPGAGKYSAGFRGPTVKGYDSKDAVTLLRKVFVYWWGAMQLAWEMVERVEEDRAEKFERVVFLRVGIDVTAKTPAYTALRGQLYTATDVPDTFWILSRRVAAEMLQTAGKTLDCMAAPGCCASMRGCKYKISWYIPCLWSRRLNIPAQKLPTHNKANTDSKVNVKPPSSGVCYPWNRKDKPADWAGHRSACQPAAPFTGPLADFSPNASATERP